MDIDTQVFTDKFIVSKCPTQLRKKATIYVYEFHVDYKDTLNYDKFHAPLHKIFETVANYTRHHPKKKVVLQFVISAFQGDLRQNMFCNENILKLHIFFDAISNWAFIHNIEVIMKSAFDTPDSLGWWSALGGHAIFARNYPHRSNFGRDPCYRWGKDLKDDITLEKFKGGITLNMVVRDCHRLSVWNVDELETMMMFGWHKFQNIEIVPRMHIKALASDLETIAEMFSASDFGHTLQRNKIKTGTLFVSIPLNVLSESKKLLEALRNLENVTMGGITLSIAKSEEILLNKYSLAMNEISKNTKFGIHVGECKNLTYGPTLISWMMTASYVVCEKRLLFPVLEDQLKIVLQQVFDWMLVTKSILWSNYPHFKDVHFRLDIFASVTREEGDSEREKNERYVKLLSYILKISRDYKITVYFRGFDNSCVDHNMTWSNSGTLDVVSKGWWQIGNYLDLSIPSVYTDKHSAYFVHEQWRPTLLFRAGPDIQNQTGYTQNSNSPSLGLWAIFTIVGVAACVVFLSLLVTFHFVMRYRKMQSFLTEKEMKEFYEGTGSEIECKAEEENSPTYGENVYLTRNFDMSFEIPKEEYKLDRSCILGKGAFGTVYKALIKEVPVAVKVPHDTCSRETFRSMLIEVKVLSHLGLHPNVLAFVGCYTKEIARGVIYIATELCEKGSLQDHLRREPGTTINATTAEYVNAVRVDELMRFSMEIASGMEYIGSKYVIHGDLSTRNVLLDRNLNCKIGDFGLSRKLYEYTEYVKKNQEPLPWRWMAYESLTKMEFTTKSDVWSYGVTIWEIFGLGEIPYPGLSWTVDFADNLKNGLRIGRPQYATEAIYEQMLRCWELDPDQRPLFNQLKEFFHQLHNQQMNSPIYENLANTLNA